MKVAFVFPPYTHKKFAENVSVVDTEFGCYPPLALAYVAAILETEGHEVLIIDANAEGISKKEALTRLNDFGAEVLGFDIHSVYNFFDTLDWIRYFKKEANLPVFAGGYVVSDYPHEILDYKVIDYLVLDNSLKSLPRLLHAIAKGRGYGKIAGIGYLKDRNHILNKPDEDGSYCNLDKLPLPARHLLPNDKYYSFISKKKNFTIMLTSRGCPFNCVFCAIRKKRYLQRTVKRVIDEIEVCIKEHHIREIDFFDATFTANKKWVHQFCDEIKRKGLEFDWSCRTRVDCVDEQVLSAMASAGCKRIYYGIESADDDVLESISKDISISQVRAAIDLTNRHGIKALGFFMIGNPRDTKESIEKSIRLALDLDLDYVQFSRTIPKPGTDLVDELEDSEKDYWRDYMRGSVPERRIRMKLCNISDEDIEIYTKKAYVSFYLRPKYIFRTLREIRSLHELRRYVKAGTLMLTSFFSSDND